MSESTANHANKKRRRTVVASISLLAVLAVGGIMFGVVEHVRESVDRVH